MKGLSQLVLITLFWLLSPESNANVSYVKALTSLEQFIGESPVRALHKDSNGSTWVALQSGLYWLNDRNSGNTIFDSRRLQRVVASEIVALASGPEGRIFALSSRDGVFVSSATRSGSTFYRLEPRETTPGYGRHIEVDSDGTLGIQYDNKIDFVSSSSALADADYSKRTYFNSPDTIIISTQEAGFCAAFEHRVVCNLLSDKPQTVPIFEGVPGSQIVGLHQMKDRRAFFILFDDGKAVITPISGVGKSSEYFFRDFIPEEFRTIEQHEKTMLIATSERLHALDLDSETLSTIPTGSLARITGLSVDGQGFWVLTEKGVSYFTRSYSSTWTDPTLKSPIEVLSFTSDTSREVFIGSHDGLFSWDREGNRHHQLTLNSSADPAVTAIALNGTDLLVGSFRSGLGIFEQSRSVHATYHEKSRHLRGKGITSILSTSSGFIIGTFQSGIKHLSGGHVSDVRMPTAWQRSPSPITSITAIPQSDRVLASTENELFVLCFDAQSLYICESKNLSRLEMRPRVLSTAVDSAGIVWLGTLSSGLFSTSIGSLYGETAISPRKHNRVTADSVYSIVTTPSGTLWAGTNDGIFVLPQQTQETLRLGKLHGLANVDFNHGASLLLPDGAALFGGRFGFDLIDTHITPKISEQSRISLKSITANSREFGATIPMTGLNRIRIDSNVSYLEFGFTVNDFREINRNEYFFTLQGFDNGWQSAGSSNVARYRNVPPGKYTFRAKGANATGNLSQNEISLEVIVLPPAWRSWWAISCYVLLLACLLVLFKRLNEKSVLRRERLRLAEAGAAAYARLEDDYQEEREANERLLLSRKSAALSLLDVVETTFSAQDAEIGDPEHRSAAILGKLTTLKHLQELTTRARTAEKSDLHALTNEIATELAMSDKLAARAIISNEVSTERVPLEHAIYLCLAIHESLHLALLGRDHNDAEAPLVLIDLSPPTLLDSGEYRYDLFVTDSALPATDERGIESFMPLTLHLIESRGGDIEDSYETGNRLHVQLRFNAPSDPLD